eukprot:scaffold1411_cov252-Pinguiococcus_pyrenoidosus.AAC.8
MPAVRPMEPRRGALVEDLNTFLCEDAREKGYILTCSTFVRGPGVEIALEQSGAAMKVQYQERYQRK